MTRKHCAMTVVRRSHKFSPRRRPLPGGAGRPKFNQLEMDTTFTYEPSLVKIDARNFELSCNRPTNTYTHINKQTEPITIHCAGKLSAQCNKFIRVGSNWKCLECGLALGRCRLRASENKLCNNSRTICVAESKQSLHGKTYQYTIMIICSRLVGIQHQ